jgi:hypothetical protein
MASWQIFRCDAVPGERLHARILATRGLAASRAVIALPIPPDAPTTTTFMSARKECRAAPLSDGGVPFTIRACPVRP